MGKPGRGTIQTLATAVLQFETSKSAMRENGDRAACVEAIRDPAIALSLARETMANAIVDDVVRHRELRRLARRLAKVAARRVALLEESNAHHVATNEAFVRRIQKLEAEIDRMNDGSPGGYVELERRAIAAEARVKN